MSDNLADQITFESEPKEHDVEAVDRIRVDGTWVSIIPGSLILQVAGEGLIAFEADLADDEDKTDGDLIAGMLSDITGLRSMGE